MIGVFGGTFDPIHFAHLRMALEAAEALAADEMRFVPCRLPAHRAPALASAADRVAMLRRAIDDLPGFVVDEREIGRAGPSYMVDTLASMRAEFGRRRLVLVIGSDAYLGLDRWHDWRRLVGYVHLLVLQRPGAAMPQGGQLGEFWRRRRVAHPRGLAVAEAGLVCHLTVTQLAISATAIRGLLANGRSARFLLPDTVLDYIRERRLYRTTPSSNPVQEVFHHA